MKAIHHITISAALAAMTVFTACGARNSGDWVMTSSHGSNAPTDFTEAAESAVNGVVSIKSYATARQRQSYGGYSGDPFFDFFFGTPRQQQPRQQQGQQQEQPRALARA